MRLGAFDLHIVSDGTFALDGGQMFGVVPKPLWEKQLAADARNRVRLALNCLLVRTGTHNVLIETGIGDKFDRKHSDIYGIEKNTHLLAELAKRALKPEDIHIVINTHLHFDHCGWNTRREDSRVIPTFPRARYFVQRGEWEHAFQPSERDRASYVAEFFEVTEKQTELVEGDAEIIPGVRLEVLPGHTRDLQGVRVTSEGQQAFFISDLCPTRLHLPYPWITAFDLYPMETLASKKRILPELAQEGTLVVFPHDAVVPWGRLVDREGRFEARPAS